MSRVPLFYWSWKKRGTLGRIPESGLLILFFLNFFLKFARRKSLDFLKGF